MGRSDFFQFLKERGVSSDAICFCEVMAKVHAVTGPDSYNRDSKNDAAANDACPTLAYSLYFARRPKVAFGRPRRGRRFSRGGDEFDESSSRSRSRSPTRHIVSGEMELTELTVKFSPDNSPNTSPTNSPPSSPLPSPPASPLPCMDDLDYQSAISSVQELQSVTAENTERFKNFIDPYTGAIKYLRILVIEDSRFQRKLIVRRLMQCLGEELTDYEDRWPVVSVQSGEEALSVIEKEASTPYNVFIVDENLDGGGGVLKGHEVGVLTPTIFLALKSTTGYIISKKKSTYERCDNYRVYS